MNNNTSLSRSNVSPAVNPKFFGQVMAWLAAGFLAAAVSAVILGPLIPPAFMIPLYILTFGVLMLSAFVRKAQKALAAPLAIGVPAVLGIMLYATVNSYLDSSMGDILVLALVGTVVIFTSMAVWGWTTTKNLSGWYKPMFFALIGIIVISLLNVFIFKLSILSLAVSAIALVLFSIYTVMDIQSIKAAQQNGTDAHPAVYALGLFLNIYNIFISLVNLLGIGR